MKKLAMLFMMLICAVSLNAQDTISVKKAVKESGDGFDFTYDNNAKKWTARTNKITYYIYTIKVNPQYVSSIYTEKASNNFTASGILLLATPIVASIPFLLDKNSEKFQTYTYVCEGVAGVLFISSVACFLSGASNLKKSSIILRSGKNYIVETDGTNIKIKF